MTRPFAHTALLLVTAVVLAGCSRLQTVAVPAQPSSVQRVVPDTVRLQELPPARTGGTPTRPTQVRVIRDTVVQTVDLSWLEVDRSDPDAQTVTVRTQQDSTTTERTLQMPAIGEVLRGTPDSTGTLRFSVLDQPTGYQVEADVRSIERPWYRRLWAQVRLAIAFVGGIVFGYFAGRLIPGL